jgi:hypothetical protein
LQEIWGWAESLDKKSKRKIRQVSVFHARHGGFNSVVLFLLFRLPEAVRYVAGDYRAIVSFSFSHVLTANVCKAAARVLVLTPHFPVVFA